MTPKEIQTCIVQAFQRQLRMHSIILPVAALSDAAAHAAMVLHGALVECPSCGDAPQDCACSRCQFCDADTRDYTPTPSDAKIASADRLCEQCHSSVVRAARKQRRLEIEDGHGDYLRERQMDGAL